MIDWKIYYCITNNLSYCFPNYNISLMIHGLAELHIYIYCRIVYKLNDLLTWHVFIEVNLSSPSVVTYNVCFGRWNYLTFYWMEHLFLKTLFFSVYLYYNNTRYNVKREWQQWIIEQDDDIYDCYECGMYK